MQANRSNQPVTGTDTAGPITRPPVLFLAGLLIGLLIDGLFPGQLPVPGTVLVHAMVGGGMTLAGLALSNAGVRNFSRAGTPFRSVEPSTALVTTGVHGWTRNPIYLGLFLVYIGIGIAAGSAWILFLTLPVAITLRYGVVAREESYLERRFRGAYRDYKARVRRWL